MKKRLLKEIAIGLMAIAAWILYFAVCSAPAGAPFIYAEF